MLINDLKAHLHPFQDQLKAAANRVIESGWLVMGPEVKAFEIEFACYLETNHCIGVANGTEAIELALRAVGVQSGDLVATVANAGMYASTAILSIGADPLYLDVDLKTRNTTLAEVDRALSQGVKAVVVTHLYGLATPEIQAIAARCASHGVWLIEDCAQAHGAQLLGRRVGTFGDAASFSFYPTKNLGALGDGGAVVTRSGKIADQVTSLRQYGWSKKYTVALAGACNSRLDEMQAAFLRVMIPSLDDANARRREIANEFTRRISQSLVELPDIIGLEGVGHLYVLRTQQRNALREHLDKLGIASEIHYPIPDHRQPVFGNRFTDVSLPNTELLSNEILTLPCYPEMTDLQVSEVISAVNTWQV